MSPGCAVDGSSSLRIASCGPKQQGVRAELAALCCLAPLFYTTLELPWAGKVYAVDASEEGFGVVATEASKEAMKETARFAEGRGWMVALEDFHSAIEESMFADDDRAPPPRGPARPLPVERPTIYLLHLFSGFRREGDLEAHLEVLSASLPFVVVVHSIDIEISPRLNLLDDTFVKMLMDRLSRGCYAGIMAGTPCTTWSTARFNRRNPGPPPVRDRDHLWGLPGLPGYLQRKVLLANSLALTSFALLLACSRASGVWLLENPADRGVSLSRASSPRQRWPSSRRRSGLPAAVSTSAALDCGAPSPRT